MKRRIRSILFACAYAAAFHRPEFNFALDAPDTGADGGNNNPSPAPAGGNAPTPDHSNDDDANDDDSPEPAPRPQSDPKLASAIKRKRKALFLARELANRFGINLEDVEVRETKNPQKPFEIVGLEDSSDDNKQTNKPGKAPRANPQVERLKRERGALIEWIRNNIVASRIRAACVKHGAVDDDGGMFEDIVNLILPRFVCNVDFEEGSETPEVLTYAVDGLGEPIEGATEESLVLDLLKRKPKFRKPDFRPGPGAGGSVLPGANVRRNGTPGAPVNSAAKEGAGNNLVKAGTQFFGRKIEV